MSLLDLLVLYGIAGVACGVAIYRRSGTGGRGALIAALIAIPLWPVWGPVVLTSPREDIRCRLRGGTDAARRIELALQEALEAAHGSPLAALLPAEAVSGIVSAVETSDARRAELDVLLDRPGFDLESARTRVASLTDEHVTPRAIATARLHLTNVEELHAMRERDERSLVDLADLVEALRTQLVLARFAGSSVEGVGDIVAEMWARVEGLGEAMDEPLGPALEDLPQKPALSGRPSAA
ncbi:MAG: hypothetical protein JRH11_14310 [Deltaproteobacteria bacterium]|nr:hypothetical protein [Deltaproteobacteria bacterium]